MVGVSGAHASPVDENLARTRLVHYFSCLLFLVTAAANAQDSQLARKGSKSEGQDRSADVTINHRLGQISPSSTITLPPGGRMLVKVIDTDPNCFFYNYTSKVIEPDASGTARDSVQRQKETTFDFGEIIHDGKNRDYEFSVTKRNSIGCNSSPLPERPEANPIVLHVRTFGWTIAFAGGFTVDDLTNPEFAQKATTRTIGGTDTQGFEIFRERSKEDDYSLGASAMIHLVNENPLKKIWRRWAPVSFGLSVTENSDVRYFLGSSVRASDQFFLTGGIVFGSEKTLPSGLDLGENNFTTESNALQNLGKRTVSGFFVSVSYSFLGKRDPFEQALKTKPVPTSESSKREGQTREGTEQSSANQAEGLRLESSFDRFESANQVQERNLKNDSGSELAIQKLTIEGEDETKFEIESDGCAEDDQPKQLAAAAECKVRIKFVGSTGESATAGLFAQIVGGAKLRLSKLEAGSGSPG